MGLESSTRWLGRRLNKFTCGPGRMLTDLRKAFLNAPGKILRQLSEKKGPLTSNDLRDGMLAMLAALLTKVPLRISEAMALQFGVTLFDHGSAKSRKVTIDLSEDLVKNDLSRTAKLGVELIALLDLYLKHIRPKLAEYNNTFLFPGKGEVDKSRSSDHISRSLAALTSKPPLVRMTAHQWRHVVGYIYLLEHPGCYEVVRRFLGHRAIETTMIYYAFMLENDANESLDRTIDKLAALDGPSRILSKRRA